NRLRGHLRFSVCCKLAGLLASSKIISSGVSSVVVHCALRAFYFTLWIDQPAFHMPELPGAYLPHRSPSWSGSRCGGICLFLLLALQRFHMCWMASQSSPMG